MISGTGYRPAAAVGYTSPFLCLDECRGCSVKLVEYIAMEIDTWEYRLDEGAIPTFGDLDRLARSCRKIHRALQRNGLVQ